jgi:hypothetical protein
VQHFTFEKYISLIKKGSKDKALLNPMGNKINQWMRLRFRSILILFFNQRLTICLFNQNLHVMRPSEKLSTTAWRKKSLFFASSLFGFLVFQFPSITASAHFNENRFEGNRFFQVRNVSGKVTDEKGEPLEKVTVQVKGTNVATVTAAISFSFSITSRLGSYIVKHKGSSQ